MYCRFVHHPYNPCLQCMKGIAPNPAEDSMSFKLLQLLQGEDTDFDANTSRFVRMRAKTHTAEVSLTEEISKVSAPSEEKRSGM